MGISQPSDRILIVEHDTDLRVKFTSALNKAGYMAAGAPDCSAALGGESNYDMVVIDLELPGVNGMQACYQIRRNLDVPVMLLGGDSSREIWEKVMQADADCYEVKPLSTALLVARVRAIMRRYNAREETNLQSRLRLLKNSRKGQ